MPRRTARPLPDRTIELTTSTKACPGPHIIWSALGGHGPVTAPPVTYTASIRPFAVIRSYRLDGPVSGTNTLCIGRPWTDTRWLASPSSAPCKAPVNRKTCDGQSSATTVRILSGVYAGHHIRVGNGVSVKENT